MAKNVARIVRVTVKRGCARRFSNFLARDLAPFLDAQRGVVEFGFCPPIGKSRVFLVVIIWRDLSSLRRTLGPTWRKVLRMAASDPLVERATVAHYSRLQSR